MQTPNKGFIELAAHNARILSWLKRNRVRVPSLRELKRQHPLGEQWREIERERKRP